MPYHRFIRLFALLLLLPLGQAHAQIRLQTNFYGGNLSKEPKSKGKYNTTADAREECQRILTRLQLSGHASSSLDSLVIKKDTAKAYFFVGPSFKWSYIGKGNISEELLAELNFPRDSFQKAVFSANMYLDLVESILRFYEQRGFPFVSVRLKDLHMNEASIGGELFLDKGRRMEMDTLEIWGNASIRKSFLYSYLGFRPGDPYNEEIIQSIDNKLSKLSFLSLESPSRVYFLYDKAHLVLNLKDRKTDRIDGIVGLAPNSEESDQNDLLLTGEVNIDLNNLMGSARAFDLRWKSFGERSQELKTAVNVPYLASKPFGIDGFAEFYKYDTLTINVRSGLGVQYLFQGTNYLRFFYENSLSILQTIDTNQIRNSKVLPITNPVKMRTYGVDFLVEQLDYRINPRKGFILQSKVGLGNKIIEKDGRIEAVLFTNGTGEKYTVYDSVDLRLFTGRLDYRLAWFIPLGEKSAIVPGVEGKHIISDKIFFDELFRIGGNNDLKGFDEKSVQASSYHIYELQYRYLIGRNSFFHAFFNGAYYQNFSEGNRSEDFPFGFGVGANLEVKSGILRLAYALGKQKGNPILFSQSKIHFGIISYL